MPVKGDLAGMVLILMHVEASNPPLLSPASNLRPAPSFCSSTTSEIWSHGSSYDQLIPVFAQMDSKQANEPPQYRYELGGILVYENTLSSASAPTSNSSSPRKRSIDMNLPDADRRKLATMPQYGPFPAFSTDSKLGIPPGSLRFNSRFESGNLKRAIRMMENEYSLLLQEDTNTAGHTQWYYFSVGNRGPGTYKFTVLNLYKPDSLYAEGMLPAVLSLRKQQVQGLGWHHAGSKVTYYESSSIPAKSHYALSFTYTFEYENDTVFFAHAVPYTYQELCKWVDGLKVTYPDRLRVNSMCQTLAGNVCELLTITEDVGSYKSFETEALEWHMSLASRKVIHSKSDSRHRHKKGVVLTARVHPGETVGSHMIRGAVEFLLSNDPLAQTLRKSFVFKVVPMLNPDGVRYGNYRCSLLGVDLNRRWLNPSKNLHPTVFYTKRMMQVFAEEHEVAYYCDFHGHSSKRNVFMYGCSKPATCFESRKMNVSSKLLPLMLSTANRLVSWSDCHFHMDKSKEATARAVVCTELGILHSYTIEASFYGPEHSEAFEPSRPDLHMSLQDYEQVGASLIRSGQLFSSHANYLEALSFMRDFFHLLKPCLSDYQDTFYSEQNSPVMQLRTEEDELWESLVELDNSEDDFQSSGESSMSSDEEDKGLKPQSRDSNSRLKASGDSFVRVENTIERNVTSKHKTYRQGYLTPKRLPLAAGTHKTKKIGRARTPVHPIATEPALPRRGFRLEVCGNTHRSQLPLRQRSKPLNLSSRVCMIESMRKALKKGAIKPLLCRPASPSGIPNCMRVSARRLRTFAKTPD